MDTIVAFFRNLDTSAISVQSIVQNFSITTLIVLLFLGGFVGGLLVLAKRAAPIIIVALVLAWMHSQGMLVPAAQSLVK